MRTTTQKRHAVANSVEELEALRAIHTYALVFGGIDSEAAQTATHELVAARERYTETLRAALAEVELVCSSRIGMWEAVIERSTDDDEIRDAQAAQSELRWLLLQLEGEA